MNKIAVIVFSFLLSGFTTFSQNVVLLDEQFNDNNNAWPIEATPEGITASIKNGEMVILNTTNERAILSIDLKKEDFAHLNYSIELKISMHSGSSSTGFGLVWGENSEENDFSDFLINSKKMMCIKHKRKQQGDTTLLSWRKIGLNGKGASNILKIDKEGNQTSFYINNELIHHHADMFLKGSKIGIIVDGKGTVYASGIKVIQHLDAINDIVSNKMDLERTKLGENINTKYGELSPVVSPDGSKLCVVRSKHPSNTGAGQDQDIWCSDKVDDEWSLMKNLGTPVNDKYNNFLVSIAPDNNTMVLGIGVGSGGISSTEKEHAGWAVPEKQRVIDYMNLSNTVSFYATSDNQRLLMAVQRLPGYNGKDDVYGEKDLFVSVKDEDGNWGKPVNLGAVINTYGDEDTPFLAADNKTLYFASNGHPGYGAMDIFVTKRLDDTWTNWTKPKNMGEVINSRDFEQGYMLDAKGTYAYFSVRGDIYQLKNPFKPEPVVLVYGKVIDEKTGKPMSAEITYYDLDTDEKLGSAVSNDETGEYKIVLPYGKNYTFSANEDKFFAVSENVDTRHLKEYTEMEKNLTLAPIVKGEVIQLHNIFFGTGKAELLDESKHELDKLYDFLKDNPDVKIEISGHTDNVGDAEANLKLSHDRAFAVMDYLINRGSNKKQMTEKGYGETKPLVPNDTDENKAINRRVELEIL